MCVSHCKGWCGLRGSDRTTEEAWSRRQGRSQAKYAMRMTTIISYTLAYIIQLQLFVKRVRDTVERAREKKVVDAVSKCQRVVFVCGRGSVERGPMNPMKRGGGVLVTTTLLKLQATSTIPHETGVFV